MPSVSKIFATVVLPLPIPPVRPRWRTKIF